MIPQRFAASMLVMAKRMAHQPIETQIVAHCRALERAGMLDDDGFAFLANGLDLTTTEVKDIWTNAKSGRPAPGAGGETSVGGAFARGSLRSVP